MNYAIVETEIVNRLKNNPALSEMAEIIVLPDSIDEYKTPVVKGLITVVFMSEKYDKNQSTGQVSQHSTATFNVAVQARTLRGSKGVYAISELAKKVLVGFRPTDCGMLSLAEHSFELYQNDIWEHSIVYSCRSLRTQEDAVYFHNEITTEEVFYQPKNRQ